MKNEVKVNWSAASCGTTPKTNQDKSSDLGVKNLSKFINCSLNLARRPTSPEQVYLWYLHAWKTELLANITPVTGWEEPNQV